MSTAKFIAVVLVASLIGGFVGGLVGGNQSATLGSAGTRFPHGLSVGTNTATTANGLKVGDNGTELKEVQATTCNLSTTQLPLEATSTDVFYCAITGVASGDLVWVSLPSDGDANPGPGIGVSYAKASTTAGYIEVGLSNGYGTATSTFSYATTSVQVFVADN